MVVVVGVFRKYVREPSPPRPLSRLYEPSHTVTYRSYRAYRFHRASYSIIQPSWDLCSSVVVAAARVAEVRLRCVQMTWSFGPPDVFSLPPLSNFLRDSFNTPGRTRSDHLNAPGCLLESAALGSPNVNSASHRRSPLAVSPPPADPVLPPIKHM